MLTIHPAFGLWKDVTLEDTTDVRKQVLEKMFEDVGIFPKLFSERVQVFNIKDLGDKKTADIEINIPLCFIEASLEYTKQGNYHVIDYISGDLEGSQLRVSLKENRGYYDGTPDGGSLVLMNFKIQNPPCLVAMTQTDQDLIDILDIGLVKIEKQGLKLEKEMNSQLTEKINPKEVQSKSSEPSQIELRGPPISDTYSDGNSDSDAECASDKEKFNGFLDGDGCLDKIKKESEKTEALELKNPKEAKIKPVKEEIIEEQVQSKLPQEENKFCFLWWCWYF